jgi:putative Mn2+ efflux pump MntP
MITLIAGSFALSLLHAIIPNHWLPILAIAKKEKWSMGQTTRVTVIAGLSHAVSTVLIGLVLAFLGSTLSSAIESFTSYIAPALLISLGVFYIYQHSRHHHFHMHGHPEENSHNKIVFSLASSMFLSPCFEIEPYFLIAGSQGFLFALLLASLYTLVTVTGMVAWVRITYKGLLKLNWHAIEHNAGIITGCILIATGVFSFFIR